MRVVKLLLIDQVKAAGQPGLRNLMVVCCWADGATIYYQVLTTFWAAAVPVSAVQSLLCYCKCFSRV